MDGDMIEFFVEFYNFILSGAAISLLVAVLFIWYCVYKDMKDRQKFDDKYRKSRELTNKEWRR
jgi:multidrug efflux pump subunit AcrB